MDTHPIDPVALVAGLLFALSGAAIIAERNWDDVDVTALTAAGVAVAGIVLAAAIVSRYLRDALRQAGEFDPSSAGPGEPEVAGAEGADDTRPLDPEG